MNLYMYVGNNPMRFVDPMWTASKYGCAPFAGVAIGMAIFCDDYCGPVPTFPGCPDLPPDPDPKCKEKCFADLVKGKKPPWKSVTISFWVTSAICSFF